MEKDVENPQAEHAMLLNARKKTEKKEMTCCGVIGTVLKFIFITFGFLLFLSLVFALSVAMIVIGAIKWNAPCIESHLALYLVVGGATGIAYNLLGFFKRKQKEGQPTTCWDKTQALFSGLLGLFSLAWIIVGSVWVFSMDPGVDYANCDKLLYLFTYWSIIASFIASGAILVVGCCCFCLCVAVAGSGKE